jgi:hypothetical protein
MSILTSFCNNFVGLFDSLSPGPGTSNEGVSSSIIDRIVDCARENWDQLLSLFHRSSSIKSAHLIAYEQSIEKTAKKPLSFGEVLECTLSVDPEQIILLGQDPTKKVVELFKTIGFDQTYNYEISCKEVEVEGTRLRGPLPVDKLPNILTKRVDRDQLYSLSKFPIHVMSIHFYHRDREIRNLLRHLCLLKLISLKEDWTLPYSQSSNGLWSSEPTLLHPERFLSEVRRNSEGVPLQQKSSEFFAKVSPLPVAYAPNEHASETALLQDIFTHYDGFCLGEDHTHFNPKKFLIDHLSEMKRMGVTTLFIEGFEYDTVQSFLDEYLHLPTDEVPLPLILAHDGWCPFPLYIEVICAAKKAGVRIVAIDTTMITKFSALEERVSKMNYVAKKIIDHEKGSGKYVALMGAAHGSRYNAGVPGVAELLQCPLILIEDLKSGETAETIQVNLRDYQPEENISLEHVHVLIKKAVPK